LKTVSIVIPTYNEEQNVDEIYTRVTDVMINGLSEYHYQIIFVDDGSTDKTRDKIEACCAADKNVRAIFYKKNFGYSKNIFYAIQQVDGDCAVLLHADMQNPPEVIFDFIKSWEKGKKVVVGIKRKSKDNLFMYLGRVCYYKFMSAISEKEHVKNMTDFYLLDKEFVDILKTIKTSNPYLRGIIMEYSYDMERIEFIQEKRCKGKTHFDLYKYYDFAMTGMVSESKRMIRLAAFLGGFFAFISAAILCIYIISQFIYGISSNFPVICIILVLLFFINLLLFFIGILGEYVLATYANSIIKPFVIEDKRINFPSENK
jgi:glycosyltransferase involved in cell wall biosynthesis